MTGGISVHAVDIALGRPAADLRIRLFRINGTTRTALIRNERTDAEGMISTPNLTAGLFEAEFHIAQYLAGRGFSDPAFQDIIIFPFGISEPLQHHHLPLKFTPFGFELFLTH